MRRAIEEALDPLVGLRWSRTARAAHSMILSFGGFRVVNGARGKKHLWPQFALHVQCPWRLRSVDQVVVGSGDVQYYDANGSEPDTPIDSRLRQLQEENARQLVVQTIKADTVGGVRVAFANRRVLEMFPDCSVNDDYVEYWRLLKRGAPTQFVVRIGAAAWE